MKIAAKVRMALFILAAATLLAACAPQAGTVTYENYEKLTFGMSYDAVAGILGEPHRDQPFMGIKQCTWVNGDRHIHAKFLFGRAVYYSSKGLRASSPQPALKSAS